VSDLGQKLTAALTGPGPGSSDFDLNPEVRAPAQRTLRPAGVLVGITLANAVPELILTKRSSRLKHHPGQIAFPGGKQDPEDVDVRAAALREAEEEIGLARNLPHVLGQLPTHETVTGFSVTPIVALVPHAVEFVSEPGEVDEIFTVPLHHVLDPENYRVEGRRWRGVHRLYYTVPWGPYYIWGATARILRGLAARMTP
jgi:8-oxo-dGTP pyrophosphatase MutT (NUDIX family)